MEKHYFEPLRPHRYYGKRDCYEFAHGVDSLCVYESDTLDFVKEIPVGTRPDCHATTCDNRYVYIACQTGLYGISQETLAVVSILDTGHVYGTNICPDGDTMLLHDAFGGILVVKNIQNPKDAYVAQKLQLLPWNDQCLTLGGKGSFVDENRYYLLAGWESGKAFCLDMANDYRASELVAATPSLFRSDDLVVSAEESLAITACYGEVGQLAVIDIAQGRVIKRIPSGRGTCGLTMSRDKRYAFASNDSEDSITRLDMLDFSTEKFSCSQGFQTLGMVGRIQGITAGPQDCVYVYDCSGSGALVRFEFQGDEASYTVSCKGKKATGRCES